MLAGACSFTAIAEWAADADRDVLRALGVTGAVPSESKFRRTLQRLDADAFDDLAGQRAQRRTASVRALTGSRIVYYPAAGLWPEDLRELATAHHREDLQQ